VGKRLEVGKQKSVNIKIDKLKVTVLNYAPLREISVQFHALTTAFDEGNLVTFMPRPLYPLGEEPPVSI
jgi:hypothetical protein